MKGPKVMRRQGFKFWVPARILLTYRLGCFPFHTPGPFFCLCFEAYAYDATELAFLMLSHIVALLFIWDIFQQLFLSSNLFLFHIQCFFSPSLILSLSCHSMIVIPAVFFCEPCSVGCLQLWPPFIADLFCSSLQDESQDYYKRQQLRELAMLNSTLREDSPHPGSVSPFSNGGMKRAKPSH